MFNANEKYFLDSEENIDFLSQSFEECHQRFLQVNLKIEELLTTGISVIPISKKSQNSHLIDVLSLLIGYDQEHQHQLFLEILMRTQENDWLEPLMKFAKDEIQIVFQNIWDMLTESFNSVDEEMLILQIQKIKTFGYIYVFTDSEVIKDNLILIFSELTESILENQKWEFDHKRFDDLICWIDQLTFEENSKAIPCLILDLFFGVLMLFSNLFSREFINWKFIRVFCEFISQEKRENSLTSIHLTSVSQNLKINFAFPQKEKIEFIKWSSTADYYQFKKAFLFWFLKENSQNIQLESLTKPESLEENYNQLSQYFHVSSLNLNKNELNSVELSLNPKSSEETVKNLFKSFEFIFTHRKKSFHWLFKEVEKLRPLLKRMDSCLIHSVQEEILENHQKIEKDNLNLISQFELSLKHLSIEAFQLLESGLWDEFLPRLLEKTSKLFSSFQSESLNWDKKVYGTINSALMGWDCERNWIYPLIREIANAVVPGNVLLHKCIGLDFEWEIPNALRLKYLFYRNNFSRVFSFKILEVEKTGHSLNIDSILSILQ